MQYTEEHYAQLYNDLPEGLKDLVLSGRLAILVSAIGSRHGLNADQVADLEPAIEDVCLGLITKDELVDNILKSVNGVDQRVANRIGAEAELEILKPFEAELVIARKQKEDLDTQINGGAQTKNSVVSTYPITNSTATNSSIAKEQKPGAGPKDVSEHATPKKVEEWYSKKENTQLNTKNTFDWDKDFGKKEEVVAENTTIQTPKNDSENNQQTSVTPSIENKLDQLTESINKLVDSRFGSAEKKDDGVSEQMKELLKRLEKAEKENEENKRLIQTLQAQKSTPPVESIFGDKQNKIQIDKERKVEIESTVGKKEEKTVGNIQITSVSKQIPIEKQTETKETPTSIISSTVSKDTLDSIVEIRNKTSEQPNKDGITSQTSKKSTLSLDELISGDNKIKEGLKNAKTPSTGTLVFPGLNDEKKIDIKNISQKDSLKEILLQDLEFLKKPKDKISAIGTETSDTQSPDTTKQAEQTEPTQVQTDTDTGNNQTQEDTNTGSVTLNQFKDELLPKTKEERMKALQDKIKSLNKGVSVGGKTNITASGLDPYKI